MNSRRIIGNPLKKLPKEHKFAVEIRNKESALRNDAVVSNGRRRPNLPH
jgi:hypothetical protein